MAMVFPSSRRVNLSNIEGGDGLDAGRANEKRGKKSKENSPSKLRVIAELLNADHLVGLEQSDDLLT